ncbi:MAG: 3-deoxy-D-manno-octulosonic acid transferase [Candidatus Omnitrophica bacterium]|nr:3-deoxy-D-manno-octulosonic acid transferase [Candidatus Omnitrophota bacterium]
MRYFFDFVFMVFAVLYLPVLLLKGKAHKDFIQRFGILPGSVRALTGKPAIWVHTVSVGEVIAAQLLVRRLTDVFPGHRVIVSVTTKTGHDTAVRILGAAFPVFYFPLDIHGIILRVIDWVDPAMVILVETELWPNFITTLAEKKVPVFLVNGRISERSCRRYRYIRWAIKPVLEKITLFCMRSSDDKRRILSMGAPADRLQVTGSMKYDVSYMNWPDAREAAYTREHLGIHADDDVIIGGSTHAGEEAPLLAIYKKLLNEGKRVRLIIAPRHVGRTGEIEKLCYRLHLRPLRLSAIDREVPAQPDRPVLVVDTIGHLAGLYSLATVVFVGGSLIRKGGHNIMEPAAYKKAVLIGPSMHNFQDTADDFIRKGAALTVHNSRELESAIRDLVDFREKRTRMGENAYRLVLQNQGALEKVLAALKRAYEEIS